MDLHRAKLLAEQTLDDNGLPNWTVKFNSAKSSAGRCCYSNRTISLSTPLTQLHSDAEVIDTILHEVAHAIAGPGEHHGPRWRRIFLDLGGSGRRCTSDDEPSVPPTWIGTCPSGHRVWRHRLSNRARGMSCSRCSSKYDPRYTIIWKRAAAAA